MTEDIQKALRDAQLPDLTDWRARDDYARMLERKGPIKPTAEHLTLLAESCWSWDAAEFGAAAMNPKRPYGNSDVEDDLADHLPHLTAAERLRVHCELPAVLLYIARKAKDVAW